MLTRQPSSRPSSAKALACCKASRMKLFGLLVLLCRAFSRSTKARKVLACQGHCGSCRPASPEDRSLARPPVFSNLCNAATFSNEQWEQVPMVDDLTKRGSQD